MKHINGQLSQWCFKVFHRESKDVLRINRNAFAQLHNIRRSACSSFADFTSADLTNGHRPSGETRADSRNLFVESLLVKSKRAKHTDSCTYIYICWILVRGYARLPYFSPALSSSLSYILPFLLLSFSSLFLRLLFFFFSRQRNNAANVFAGEIRNEKSVERRFPRFALLSLQLFSASLLLPHLFLFLFSPLLSFL